MSREVLIKTVTQAVNDTRFRSRLLNDPKGTLSGLSLTREEYSALVQLTNESYEFIKANVDAEAIYTGTVTYCVKRSERESTLSRYNLTDLDKLTSG